MNTYVHVNEQVGCLLGGSEHPHWPELMARYDALLQRSDVVLARDMELPEPQVTAT
jgi:hypothetical protein